MAAAAGIPDRHEWASAAVPRYGSRLVQTQTNKTVIFVPAEGRVLEEADHPRTL